MAGTPTGRSGLGAASFGQPLTGEGDSPPRRHGVVLHAARGVVGGSAGPVAHVLGAPGTLDQRGREIGDRHRAVTQQPVFIFLTEAANRQAEFAERSSTFMEALDVDEVIAQLLASEGFSSVEEVAFVEPSEIASIEGFDENTAAEIQTRAREHLEKIEAEQDAKRKALGVVDDVATIPGLTTAMLVALGEKNVKTVEDVADCATDDLLGWNERKDKETIHHEGILDGFNLSKQEIEDLILAARVKAGWIDEADLAPEPEAEEAVPLSAEGKTVLNHVRQPITARTPESRSIAPPMPPRFASAVLQLATLPC